MHEKLKTLYEQMEMELKHLNHIDQLVVKKYMMWAFDRGENSIINRIKNR